MNSTCCYKQNVEHSVNLHTHSHSHLVLYLHSHSLAESIQTEVNNKIYV